MARSNKYITHEFYCTCCGNKGISLPRPRNSQREKLHLKMLYCIYCQREVNHVECRNYEEVILFKEKFAEGYYLDKQEKIND